MAESTKPSKALTSPGYLLPFIILTALFFIFGFITNLNMGLVPELKKIFEIQGLATWQAMLANFAFFTAYFVFSTPASRLIEAIGYKRTMVVSLFVQVAGAAMFLPAAQSGLFSAFPGGDLRGRGRCRNSADRGKSVCRHPRTGG